MKFILVLACLTAAVSAGTQEEWTQFKQTHKKSYKSLIEERRRFQIFSDNLEKINNHNEKFSKGDTTYTMKVNQFADMTEEEFKKMFYTFNPIEVKKLHEKVQEAPTEKDWRKEGAVTEVKDQGQCGSCWAFSTTGSLEGQYYLKNKRLISLSEQNLVDCASHPHPYENGGCRGGLMTAAFDYLKDYGIESEEDYPYQAWQNMTCRYDASKMILSVNSYVVIEKDSEEDLMNAVGTIGPISVAIDASAFMTFYHSGIYDDWVCQKWALNHGVLAVGYGSENGTDFWIVKNSWGPKWGEDGYIRMQRGKNMCGIATLASYPIIN